MYPTDGWPSTTWNSQSIVHSPLFCVATSAIELQEVEDDIMDGRSSKACLGQRMEGGRMKDDETPSSSFSPCALFLPLFVTWRRSKAWVSMTNDGVGRSLNKSSEAVQGSIVAAAATMPRCMVVLTLRSWDWDEAHSHGGFLVLGKRR